MSETPHQSLLAPAENKFHKGNGDDGKHYWLSPPSLLASIEAEFGPFFDPCPFPLPEGFDGLTCEWGEVVYARVIGCSSALFAENRYHPICFPLVQTDRGNSDRIAVTAIMRDQDIEAELLLPPERHQRVCAYSPMVLADAQDVRLSSHLMSFILLWNDAIEQNSAHIAGTASERTPERKWKGDAAILLSELKLFLQTSDTAVLIRDGLADEQRVLSKIIDVEARFLTGPCGYGTNVNHILEANAPIADPRQFLLRTILSLYQTLAAQAQSPAILCRPAGFVTAESALQIHSNGVLKKRLPGSSNTSNILLRLNERSVSYCNPPFGSIMHQGRKKGPTAWVRKAIEEWKKGKTVVLVYPVDKWLLMLIKAIFGETGDIRNLGDVKWIATEDGSAGKGTGRHIAMFILRAALSPQAAETPHD